MVNTVGRITSDYCVDDSSGSALTFSCQWPSWETELHGSVDYVVCPTTLSLWYSSSPFVPKPQHSERTVEPGWGCAVGQDMAWHAVH